MDRQENVSSAAINAPIEFCFEQVINPKNAPKWQSAIRSGTASEFPPKRGTVYTGLLKQGGAEKLTVSEFVPNKKFALKASDGYAHKFHFKNASSILCPDNEMTILEFTERNSDIGYNEQAVGNLKEMIEIAWMKKQMQNAKGRD
jgi:hypothetical protein